MKIEQKFSIGKKGFNFNDVRQVIDLLRDKVNNDTIVVVKKGCGYFTLDEIIRFGISKPSKTGRPYSIQGILYCEQDDLVTLEFGA